MFGVGFICPVPKMHEADFCQPQIPVSLIFSLRLGTTPKSSFQNRNSYSSSLWLLSGVWIPWPCRRENGDLDKVQERKARIVEPDYSIQHKFFCF